MASLMIILFILLIYLIQVLNKTNIWHLFAIKNYIILQADYLNKIDPFLLNFSYNYLSFSIFKLQKLTKLKRLIDIMLPGLKAKKGNKNIKQNEYKYL